MGAIASAMTLDRSKRDLIMACMEDSLTELNDLHIYYALQFFTEMNRGNFFDRGQDQRVLEKLLDKIAPLMMYPNNWIRNEAINFIVGMLEK